MFSQRNINEFLKQKWAILSGNLKLSSLGLNNDFRRSLKLIIKVLPKFELCCCEQITRPCFCI